MFPAMIVLFAVIASLIYFYFFIWQTRWAARRILESVRKNFTQDRDICVISSEALPRDTAEKYAEAREVVEGLGFKFICYAEDETFTRSNGIMIPFQYFRDEKGEVKAVTYYHPKIGYVIYEFMTELSDGRELMTSNALMAAKIMAPPIFVRNYLPVNALPSDMLKTHREQLGKILGGTRGITCSTAMTPEEILERYRHDNRAKYKFHRDRGWISLEELIRLSPKGSEATARRVYAMIQKILREEDSSARRSPQ